MKKTYMIPTLQVVKIQPAQFIAASLNASMKGSAIENSNDFGARSSRFSRWEEDDFEEE